MTDAPGVIRRVFLKSLALASAAATVPSAAWALFLRRFPVRTVDQLEYTFDPETGRLVRPDGSDEPFELAVDGLVEEPVRLTWDDIRGLRRTEQVSDFHCVEGWSVADLAWAGFRMEALTEKVRPLPEATHAVFHSLGRTRPTGGLTHYRESLPLARMLDPGERILLAYELDGKPLPLDHGAPLRVISPFDLAYKSAKYVHRIELTAESKPGWWSLANPIYPVQAPVPKDRLRKNR